MHVRDDGDDDDNADDVDGDDDDDDNDNAVDGIILWYFVGFLHVTRFEAEGKATKMGLEAGRDYVAPLHKTYHWW